MAHADGRLARERTSRVALLAGVTALLVLVAGIILFLNRGVFTYSLDDPYIHLVLARAISRGHYGFNMLEASSPSSSITFPFLLVPFVWLHIGEAGPLVLNAAALLATLWMLHVWMTRDLEASPRVASALTVSIMVGFNLVGLVFTGMEHSLQVLACVAVCIGIDRISAGRAPGRLFWAAVAVGPMIRYELLALSLTAIAYCAYRRHIARAAAALAFICVSVGGFSLALHALGLPLLPNSVLAKADYTDLGRGAGVFVSLFHNFMGNMGGRAGAVMAALAAMTVGMAARRRRVDIAVVACTLLLEVFIAGKNGWFERYEVWALVAIAVLGVGVMAPFTELGVLSGKPSVALLAVLMLMCEPYARATALTPLGANNIYGQQYQMSRLIQDLGVRSVALNDIGLIGWKNPGVYVLDLAGLSSNEALRQRLCCPQSSAWMEELARRHSVDLVMIYNTWFPSIPAGWVKVGDLRLEGRLVTPSSSVVSIYARTSDAAGLLRQRLGQFAPTLPPNARLVLVDQGATANAAAP